MRATHLGTQVCAYQSAADHVFDALGDPTRRALVARLSRRPMSVSDLGRPLGITLAWSPARAGARAQPAGPHREGRPGAHVVGRAGGLDVAAAWLAEPRALWERRLDRLGDVLAEQEQPTARQDEQG